ncbi:MAG: alpha/beta hydrolase [Pseudomonadota bacterium]
MLLRYGISNAIEKGFLQLAGRLPPFVFRAIAGRAVSIDGQTLDPGIAFALKKLKANPMSRVEKVPIRVSRRFMDVETWKYGGMQHVDRIDTLSFRSGDVRLSFRRYCAARSSRAALVYFHGGGWVLGGLDASDPICRFLAIHAGVTVFSVDYRLAPEHRFPAAVNDAIAGFRWIRNEADRWGIDPKLIAVGGDSAGGNLATVAALRTRNDERGGPAFQLLLYPVTDLSEKHPSHRLFDKEFLPTSAQADWFRDQYLRVPEDALDPNASPLLTADVGGAAPAYIATAGFDVLRDEAEAYASRLAQAGVPTTLRRHASLAHNFASGLGVSRPSRLAMLEAAAALKAGLASGGFARAGKENGR